MSEYQQTPPDSNWKQLPEDFQDGKALAPQLDAASMRALFKMLNGIHGVGCTVVKRINGQWIIWVNIEDSVRGDKELYKVPALREYNLTTGALIAAGSETDNGNLYATWDYVRAV